MKLMLFFVFISVFTTSGKKSKQNLITKQNKHGLLLELKHTTVSLTKVHNIHILRKKF